MYIISHKPGQRPLLLLISSRSLKNGNNSPVQTDGRERGFVITLDKTLNSSNETYEDAAVLFHEIKAHVENDAAGTAAANTADAAAGGGLSDVEYSKVKSDKEHGLYGSENSGYMGKAASGSPAEKIKTELTNVKTQDQINAAKPYSTGSSSPDPLYRGNPPASKPNP